MDPDQFDAMAQASQAQQRNSRRSSRRSVTSASLNPNSQMVKLQFELTIRKLCL